MTAFLDRFVALFRLFFRLKRNKGSKVYVGTALLAVVLLIFPFVFSTLGYIVYFYFYFTFDQVDPYRYYSSSAEAEIQEYPISIISNAEFGDPASITCPGIIDGDITDHSITEYERRIFYVDLTEQKLAGELDEYGNSSGVLSAVPQYRFHRGSFVVEDENFQRVTVPEVCVRNPVFVQCSESELLHEKYYTDLKRRNSFLEPIIAKNPINITILRRREYKATRSSSVNTNGMTGNWKPHSDPDRSYYRGFVGGVIFNEIDQEKRKYDIEIVSNEDKWKHDIFHTLGGAILESSSSGVKLGAGSLLVLEEAAATNNLFLETISTFENIESALIVLLFPLLLSIFLPFLLAERIKDRKIVSYVELYGISRLEFESMRFIFDYAIYLLFALVLILFPLIFIVSFFVRSNPIHYLVMYLLWGLVLISAASFLSLFQDDLSIAYSYGFLLVFCSFTLAGCLNILTLTTTEEAPWYYMIFPPFALSRGFTLIVAEYTLPANRGEKDEVYFWHCMFWLFCQALFFTAVFFTFPTLKAWVRSTGQFLRRFFWRTRQPARVEEDEDVTREREMIIKGINGDEMAIRTSGLTKLFGSFTAVNDVYLSIRKGECFALLGPNGAGKTTLLNMIAGTLKPTRGGAKVKDFYLRTGRRNIRDLISYCPQEDMLWDNLSVEEHLRFYHRVRGVDQKKVGDFSEQLATEVGLVKESAKFAGDLSGGQKRRLSIAIALCGFPPPSILLLDEPTTSLDPLARRDVWNVIKTINDYSLERCILLTTHNMLEAEELADRIAILTHGRLRCVGDLKTLRERYSQGYRLLINSTDIEQTDDYIKSFLSVSSKQIIGKKLYYRIKECEITKLFDNLTPGKMARVGIQNWTMNQANLEEVYLRLSSENESNDVDSEIKIELQDLE